MRRKTIRRLCSEALEARRVLAGNVNVVLSGNNLTITGDELNNTVTITQVVATNTLHIAGLGTTFTLNGAAGAAFQDVVIADFGKLFLKIDAKEAEDSITLGQLAGDRLTLGKLSINSGAGTDFVAILRTDVTGTGTSRITLGKNTEVDKDYLSTTETNISGGLQVRSGDGDDELSITINTNVDGLLDVDAQKGNDALGINNGSHGALRVKLGDGNDQASLGNLNITAGKLTFDAGKGSDSPLIFNTVTVQQDVSINLGTDTAADTGVVSAVALTSATKVSIRGGKGADRIAFSNLHAPVVDLNLGDGADELRVFGLAADGALNPTTKLTINFGAGDDVIAVANNILAATIDVKFGDGANTLLADGVTATTKLKVTSGKNADTFNVTNISAPDLFVDLGDNGNDVLTASLLTVGTAGKLTLKGGAGLGDTLNFNTAGSTIPPLNAIDKSGFEIENIT